MKSIKKITAGILALAVLLATGGEIPMKAKAAGPDRKAGTKVEISVPDNKVQVYEAGETQDFVLNIKNEGTEKLTNVTVSPRLRNSGEKWPFKTEYQNYIQTIETLPSGQEAEIRFPFTAREDVTSGRYVLTFDTKSDQSGAEVMSTKSFYVNAVAKDQGQPGGDEGQNVPVQTPGESGGGMDFLSADAGGFDNGGVSFGGGDTSASGSVPRVIVTGFTTDPAEVRAGSNFTLTIHLKNTSKTTKVSNMLFDIAAPTEGTDEQTSAPAFLPASGASSIYLDSMQAGGTADISMQLNAKADLVQKPYSINLTMKYEDANGAQIEGQSSLSIPVKQDARFEFSDFEITPESISVGEEANISCSLYNLGRIKLYNVRAIFEGNGIKKEEVFLGNVEPGTSTSIDAMLEGQKATDGMQKMKMTLSYEDESANTFTAEKEFQLEVMEQEDTMEVMSEQPEEGGGFPVIPILAVILVIVGIAVIVILRKKKKQRNLALEEEGLLDELDRPSENE